MRPARHTTAAMLAGVAVLALTACGDRLDRIGKPPQITAPGNPLLAVPSPAIPRKQIAVASPHAGEPGATASLWRSGPESLFGDRRARGLGDILTVVIEIDDQAEIRNATNRNRSADENIGISNLLGAEVIAPEVLPGSAGLNPAVGIDGTSSTSGDGSVRRNEQITLRVAATVTEILPNGHFVIAGSQEVRVNYELRDLQVAGIVRPQDISRANTITYDKVAEARVVYGGRGQITDLQQPRYGYQIIDALSPF